MTDDRQEGEDARAIADQRLEEALEASGARDPRDFFRVRLRELKAKDPTSYDQAVRYYREVLLHSIAVGDAEPIAAWTEYGRTLASLVAGGRTVSIDSTGRAEPYDAPPSPDALVLHIPDHRSTKALLVALPPTLTEAQRATYDWLVTGKNRMTV